MISASNKKREAPILANFSDNQSGYIETEKTSEYTRLIRTELSELF